MIRFALPLCFTVSLAACATMAPAPAGMEAGKFVNYACEKGGFQARWNPDTKSVRVRSHHGAAELSAAADGSYTGDGFVMRTGGSDGVSLEYQGKALNKNCRKAA